MSAKIKASVLLHYILKRFHLVPLLLLVFSDILVVWRVLETQEQFILKYALSLLFVLLYLFSNRIGDDIRDYHFDLKHYPDRAVQKGQLSLKQLHGMSYLVYALMLIIALLINKESLIAFSVLLFVSLLAKRDFFLPESFKSKWFFSYNLLNMLQMLALQIFVYLALGVRDFDALVVIHILLVFILSLQTEVTRKIKPVAQSSMDNYSDRLGMKGALILWFFFGLMALTVAIFMADLLNIPALSIFAFELFLLPIALFGAIQYYRKADVQSENIFWLSFILFYIGQNLMLFYG